MSQQSKQSWWMLGNRENPLTYNFLNLTANTQAKIKTCFTCNKWRVTSCEVHRTNKLWSNLPEQSIHSTFEKLPSVWDKIFALYRCHRISWTHFRLIRWREKVHCYRTCHVIRGPLWTWSQRYFRPLLSCISWRCLLPWTIGKQLMSIIFQVVSSNSTCYNKLVGLCKYNNYLVTTTTTMLLIAVIMMRYSLLAILHKRNEERTLQTMTNNRIPQSSLVLVVNDISCKTTNCITPISNVHILASSQPKLLWRKWTYSKLRVSAIFYTC